MLMHQFLARHLATLSKPLVVRWAALGLALVGFATWLTIISVDFGYDTAVIDMPIPYLVAGLVIAGLAYLFILPKLIRQTTGAAQADIVTVFWLVVVAGVVARLVLFASEPMLENDYQRYFWDGAVTAHGINPYRTAPETVRSGGAPEKLAELKKQSGVVFERISYKNLTTIYPPVTQAAFAIAHFIKPWSLTAWRSVVMACDLGILALLVLLLRAAGRSQLWSAIYWWNPLVLKEMFNSAHMDGLVVLFILVAIYAATRALHLLATTAIAFAVGTKLWPALLIPLVWRPLVGSWRRLAFAAAIFTSLVVLFALPIVQANLDANSGLIAYAQTWKLNSPLFHMIEQTVQHLMMLAGWGVGVDQAANFITKAIIAFVISGVALACAWRPSGTVDDLVARVLLVTATLVFLSPAIYPWYTVWFIALLAFRPIVGLLALTPAMGLYYLRFYLYARGDVESFNAIVAWVIWVPVWALCLHDVVRRVQNPTGHTATS